MLLFLEVKLVRPDDIDADSLTQLAVMLTNKLCYRGKQAAKLERKFEEHKEEGSLGRSKQQAVQERFQGNDSALFRGITGGTVTVTEMFEDLAGPGWESMLLDRFLLKSLLITPSEDAVPTYSQADEENLLRLTRGLNKNYLPAPLEVLAGHVVPVQTFANVRFFAANEGIAAHVKPAPGQDFLRTEFSSRTDSEYMLLFVLAVYQHYRLIDLIRTLAEKTADLNENNLDSSRIDQLLDLRQELAVHDVKYINTQPAFLTNYQQYYTGLRQGMNTGVLAEKLRRSVTELDALLNAQELHRVKAEQREKKEQKERDEKGKMWLAMIAESVAVPYYFYSLLAHVLHINHSSGWCFYTTLFVTLLITYIAVSSTYRIMIGKKIWGILPPVLSRLQRLL